MAGGAERLVDGDGGEVGNDLILSTFCSNTLKHFYNLEHMFQLIRC